MADPILVLGATGTHGGAVVRALVAAGRSVRALVRDPESPRAQAVRAGGVELVTGDLMDPRSLTRAFAGVGAVYAVTTPFEHGAHDEERQGAHIIEAASQAGLPWLLLASVAAAGRAPVPHFASKRATPAPAIGTMPRWFRSLSAIARCARHSQFVRRGSAGSEGALSLADARQTSPRPAVIMGSGRFPAT